MTPEELFLSHLPLIDQVVAWVCRRHCCRQEEAEDFASLVKLKLIENDYARIRKYKGDSKLSTYLAIVIQNLYLDYRNQIWGKWRPSAEAERLGPIAVKLEELRWRDGHTFDEACKIVRINLRMEISQEELDWIVARLPQKPPRRMESEEELQNLPAATEQPDERTLDGELREMRERAAAALKKALDELKPLDRLIIRMAVLDDWKTVEIAQRLNLEAKPLYRRIKRILKDLRWRLERQDITWRAVADLFGRREREPE